MFISCIFFEKSIIFFEKSIFSIIDLGHRSLWNAIISKVS